MKHRKGFTLVELLAVMLILAILVGLVVGVTGYATARTNRLHTLTIMDVVLEAIQAYYEDTNGCPASLAILVQNPEAQKVLANLDSETWKGKGSDKINDAYGSPLKYEETGGLGGCPALISGGPDGDSNTEDDNIRSDKR